MFDDSCTIKFGNVDFIEPVSKHIRSMDVDRSKTLKPVLRMLCTGDGARVRNQYVTIKNTTPPDERAQVATDIRRNGGSDISLDRRYVASRRIRHRSDVARSVVPCMKYVVLTKPLDESGAKFLNKYLNGRYFPMPNSSPVAALRAIDRS